MRGERAPVAFTVDVERDWAGRATRGVREALPELLALLDRHEAAATFFVVGELAELVRPLLPADGVHEIGSHGLTHRRLTRLPSGELWEEVAGSRRALERAGYEVAGFRAPFFAAPAGLGLCLAAAGYAYDASVGRLHPFSRAPAGLNAGNDGEPLPSLELSALRLLGVPFSLTWLRVLGRVGLRQIPAVPGVFCCHLHELLDESPGWQRLPPPLRALHRRGSGRPALALVDEMLARPDLRFISCSELLTTVGSAPAEQRHAA